jgi:hypothetical protein
MYLRLGWTNIGLLFNGGRGSKSGSGSGSGSGDALHRRGSSRCRGRGSGVSSSGSGGRLGESVAHEVLVEEVCDEALQERSQLLQLRLAHQLVRSVEYVLADVVEYLRKDTSQPQPRREGRQRSYGLVEEGIDEVALGLRGGGLEALRVALLDLGEEDLWREVLLLALLERERLVVERLVIVLLVHLAPDLVPLAARAAPLLVLLLEALEDDRHRDDRVRVEAVDDIRSLVSVDPLDALQMDHCAYQNPKQKKKNTKTVSTLNVLAYLPAAARASRGGNAASPPR